LTWEETIVFQKIKAGFFEEAVNFQNSQFPTGYLGKGELPWNYTPLFPFSELINIYFLTDPSAG